MLRQNFTEQLDHDPDFEWRGSQVTRIENLSDIVFALAFSMVVTASDVQFTFAGIKAYLTSLVPISAAFIYMLVIWNRHFLFFRRYGLADSRIIWLNALLLLTILSIAYPMRFIFDSLYAWILLQFGQQEMMFRLGIDSYRDAGEVVAYFGVIYAVLSFIHILMYARARSKAAMLRLNDLERAHTRGAIWIAFGNLLTGAITAVVAYFTLIGPFAGLVFNMSWMIDWFVEKTVIAPVRRTKQSVVEV